MISETPKNMYIETIPCKLIVIKSMDHQDSFVKETASMKVTFNITKIEETPTNSMLLTCLNNYTVLQSYFSFPN